MSDDSRGVINAAADLGKSLVAALPPAFLLLILINAAFIGVVLWFLDDQLDQRTALVGRLLDHCMDIAAHAPPAQH